MIILSFEYKIIHLVAICKRQLVTVSVTSGGVTYDNTAAPIQWNTLRKWGRVSFLVVSGPVAY